MSELGQTQKSGRTTGESALPPRTGMFGRARQVRKVPQPDSSAASIPALRRRPQSFSMGECNDYPEKSLDRSSTGRSAWACSSKNLRDARSSITSRSRIN
jgi:hypothetical protein